MLVKAQSNVPEVRELFKSVMAEPERLFEMMEFDMREIAERTLSEMLQYELTLHLGREKHVRATKEQTNRRNGTYPRQYTVKNIGELEIDVPRDREGSYSSQLIEKYDRYDKRLEKDISLMWLSGLSTRGIELISKSILGRKISHGEVSKINGELLTGIDTWRTRDLSAIPIKYMYIDGVNFAMRNGVTVDKIPMLVVIGVRKDTNRKVFLALQKGDKESASSWREVFKDMKARGLRKDIVELGIMDGLPGLMTVFEEEFTSAKIQRCQVHVARNVLCKVSWKTRGEVTDALRDIFYAGDRTKATEAFHRFVKKYEHSQPSAVQCLSKVIEQCLTFHSFPEHEWVSLRTTNPIERVNKEFKRRTKPMEILAGETSAYRLLSFIALKLELGWRKSPLDRAQTLPALTEFTQAV
jgi:putative transposase